MLVVRRVCGRATPGSMHSRPFSWESDRSLHAVCRRSSTLLSVTLTSDTDGPLTSRIPSLQDTLDVCRLNGESTMLNNALSRAPLFFTPCSQVQGYTGVQGLVLSCSANHREHASIFSVDDGNVSGSNDLAAGFITVGLGGALMLLIRAGPDGWRAPEQRYNMAAQDATKNFDTGILSQSCCSRLRHTGPLHSGCAAGPVLCRVPARFRRGAARPSLRKVSAAADKGNDDTEVAATYRRGHAE